MKTKKTKPTQVKTKTTTSKKTKDINLVEVDNSLHSKIVNLESAYADAISGKIKFGEVKDIFKKLHKEIKSSTKK